MRNSNEKRRDNKGRLLYVGEYQEPSGLYTYHYTDARGRRHKLTSWTLTKADAQPVGKRYKAPLRDQIKDAMADIADGICYDNMTVLQLVDRYLATKTGVKHNTLANYNFVRNILEKENFSAREISKVKPTDAKLFLIKLQKDGRGYSTIHSVRGVLRPAFQMAVDDDMIRKNPFNFMLASVVVNDSVTREAITRAEERKFLAFVENDKYYCRYYDGIYILFKTGMRISEFCGLTISDIDFANHRINIDHQLQRKRDMTYVIDSPKTEAGIRVIPMAADVEGAFRRVISGRKRPQVEPLIDGHTGFLFLDKDNKPMTALHWEHFFAHIVDKYNRIYKVQLPKITPHVARHTYCSNMARSGMNPKTLQYLMGHSDISVTMNVYTHLGLWDAEAELNRLAAEQKTDVKPGSKSVKAASAAGF